MLIYGLPIGDHGIAGCRSVTRAAAPSFNRQSVTLQSAVFNRQFGSLLQLHDRDSAAALMVGSRTEGRDGGMRAQELRDRATELPCPVAVNDPHAAEFGDVRLVEKTLHARDGFV